VPKDSLSLNTHHMSECAPTEHCGHQPFAQTGQNASGLVSIFNRGFRAQSSEGRCSYRVIASVSLLLRATLGHCMPDTKVDNNWWGERFCCTHSTLHWIKY